MRETSFINQNKDKWKEFEKLTNKTKKDPDELSRYFVEITDDLSYARTFYPNRSVRIYINGIARKAFQSIYKNKKHHIGKKIINFWLNELPRALYEARIELYISTAIFLISVFIGCVSSHYDKDFASYFLGEDYIRMTEENIAKGNPMGVYKQDNTFDMFFRIATNNLRIDFLMFVMGALLSIGTIMFVIYNGVMVGTFQYFFYAKGLLIASALTIWLHGTLELGMMVIVAAAGITLGRGLLFPGSYKRIHAFQLSALRGIKIFLSVLPFTFFAAIVETWITRHDEVSSVIKLSLILVSLAFVVGYFYILPLYKNKKGHFATPEKEFAFPPENNKVPDVFKLSSNDEIYREMFWYIRKNIVYIIKSSAVISLVFALFCLLLFKEKLLVLNTYQVVDYFVNLIDFENYEYIYWPIVLTFTAIFYVAFYSFDKNLKPPTSNIYIYYSRILTASLAVSLLLFSPFLVSYAVGFFNVLIFFPISMVLFIGLARYEKNIFSSFFTVFKLIYSDSFKFIGMTLIIYLIGAFIYFLFTSTLTLLMQQVIFSNLPVDEQVMNNFTMIMDVGLSTFIFSIAATLWTYASFFLYFSLKEIHEASGLKSRIDKIGNHLPNLAKL
jgi:uncharacterized membrane protein SpoIIM required for sporulation